MKKKPAMDIAKTHESCDTDKNVEYDYDAYKALLSRYEDESKVFHSNGVDAEVFNTLFQSEGAMFTEGLPTIIGTNGNPLVSQNRVHKIVQELVPGDNVNTYISALPAEAVVENVDSIKEQNDKLGLNIPILIFASYDVLNHPLNDFQDYAETYGVKAYTLEHPITKTSAALNLFELDIELKQRDQKFEPITLGEAAALLKDEIVSAEDGGKIRIKFGGEFDRNEEKELWNLFSTRFEDISDNMPFELVESEESTRAILEDQRNIFVCKYDKENRIIASTIMTSEKDAYPWVSKAYIENLSTVSTTDDYDMFIPVIVAERGSSEQSAFEIMSVLAQLGATTGHKKLKVRFECTDISSLYIPRKTRIALKKSAIFEKVNLNLIAEKLYLLLEIN